MIFLNYGRQFLSFLNRSFNLFLRFSINYTKAVKICQEDVSTCSKNLISIELLTLYIYV